MASSRTWAQWRDLLLLGCLERLQFSDEIRDLVATKDTMSVGFAQFHLSDMVDTGLLVVEGDKRGRRWRLTTSGKQRRVALQRVMRKQCVQRRCERRTARRAG